MKIAQVSPLFESVPPKYYGGTERVVSYLTEELVRQGHDVTLFASGDSKTRARLVAPCAEALRLKADCNDRFVHHILQLEMVLQRRDEFDIIHYHTDYMHYPLSRHLDVPCVTTLHGRLDLHDLHSIYQEFTDLPLVSISHSQREPLPQVNWVETIHHGLPLDLYHPREQPGDYLAFLGRISPEKRVDRAIEIARAVGLPLKVAAKIDEQDREYYDRLIAPMLDDPLVEYLGEIGEREKGDFLGGARALLFPIDWCEPFGLVMIESFACGTPVVAFRRGSVPEVLDDGLTGYIVDDVAGAIEAVKHIDRLDRRRVRETFELRFASSRMARDYTNLYQRVIDARRSAALHAAGRQVLPLASRIAHDLQSFLTAPNGHHGNGNHDDNGNHDLTSQAPSGKKTALNENEELSSADT